MSSPQAEIKTEVVMYDFQLTHQRPGPGKGGDKAEFTKKET
jgi:hypothetical protein